MSYLRIHAVAIGLLITAAGPGQEVPKEEKKRWIHPACQELTLPRQGPFAKLGLDTLLIVENNAVRIGTERGKAWTAPYTMYRGSSSRTGTGVPSPAGQVIKSVRGPIIVVWRDTLRRAWDNEKGEPGPSASGDVWTIRSVDNGASWVNRQRIFEGVCGHPPVDIIQTRTGRIVVPVQFYLRNPGRNVTCIYSSDDDGQTWQRSNIIDLGGHGHHDGVFEPTLVELKDGRLWMLMRTNWDRFWEAFSEDGGLSWRTIKPSAIEASSSPGYLTRLDSGRLVLLWNRLYPETKDTYARKSGAFSQAAGSWHREELSIAFSGDEGATWTPPIVIAREPDAWIAYPYLFEPVPGELWIFTRQGGLSVRVGEKDLLPE